MSVLTLVKPGHSPRAGGGRFGKILYVHALGQAGLVPFNVGQDNVFGDAMQSSNLALGGWHVAGVVVVAIKEALAVEDSIADFDSG